MTVAELIAKLQTVDPNLPVVTRYVGNGWNDDSEVTYVSEDIVGGPIKANERMAMVIRYA